MKRVYRLLMLLLSCCGVCWPVPGQAATLTLARDGKARMTIVVNTTGAIPAEKTAAGELAAYLRKITGATFTTIEKSALPAGAPAIYLGDTAFARAQGIDPGKLGAEEFILRTVGKSLILTGGRPRGTLYAVYELLEGSLGCRWYTPWTEKVPNLRVCTIPTLNLTAQPYMRFRSHYTHLGGDGWKMYNVRNRFNEVTTAGLDDAVGGGVAYDPRIYGGHGFAPYLPVEKYFKDHPEYYSLRAGKRVPSNGLDGNHACLTNPDVLRIITEGVLEDIAKNPTAYCFTVAVNDGGSSTICDCPECRNVAKQHGATEQRGTDGGLMIWFVNQVADVVKVNYPDKFIRTLAYGPASHPPKGIRAKNNVIVQVCAGPRSEAVWLPKGPDAQELQTLRAWTNYADHIWVWDYALACYNQPAFFRPLTWKMDEQMKFFKKLHAVDGVFQENELMAAEDSMFPQFYEMNEWIYGRLCRNPDADVNALIADFVTGYYGKAAAPFLLQYLDMIRARLPQFPFRVFDYTFAQKAQGLFDKAETAAMSDAVALDRIRACRMQLDLATLAWRNTIVRDYLSHGGAVSQYPFRISVLKNRLLKTLETTKDPFILYKTPRYSHKGRSAWEQNKDIIRRYIEEISAGVEYTPLPKEIAALPPGNVIDLTAPLFTERIFPLVVPDPEATIGLAVPRTQKKEMPMNISIYSSDPKRPQGAGVTIREKDVPGKGYHLYTGPRFPLNEWTFVYLTASWQLQKHLYTLYDPAHPDQEWQVYASMKFTGPDYPFGDPKDPNGLFIDRLILVKIPPRK
ncbi:MAG: DUF4838 domain-containing protein [Armatimonadota bacterium]